MATATHTFEGTQPRPRRPATEAQVRRSILYVVTIVLAVFFMFPLFWAVMSGLKTPAEMYAFPPVLIPAHPRPENYVDAFTAFPFALWYKNTIEVVILATLGTVFSASLVAYGFARFDFRFKNAIFVVTLATMMLPGQVSLIPRYILFHFFGWIDTLFPLWVPAWFGGSAFAIFLMRQFFLTLPRELDEAALIDGASYFRILWSILAPLCKPALATLAILTLIANWDSFLDPVIYLQSQEHFTVAIGIWYFKQQEFQVTPTDQLLMAAAVTSIIPPIALFFSFQRYFVEGIVLSGLKE
ncbi:MAG TPA: carbohydrate ABC transporter permease [Chloroflexota bacterium]|nr:carbohydrate ABC transporter permease [Chloroflexota bacterium]